MNDDPRRHRQSNGSLDAHRWRRWQQWSAERDDLPSLFDERTADGADATTHREVELNEQGDVAHECERLKTLDTQIAKVEKERDRLVTAIASGGQLAGLLEALKAREPQRATLEAERTALSLRDSSKSVRRRSRP